MSNIKEQLKYSLSEFDIPSLENKYKGKVRNNFYLENEIIMVT